MKESTARRLNLAFWFILVVVIMSSAHHAWSQYGAYTLGSFMASLVMHAGPCALFGFWADEAIEKYFKNKQ